MGVQYQTSVSSVVHHMHDTPEDIVRQTNIKPAVQVVGLLIGTTGHPPGRS